MRRPLLLSTLIAFALAAPMAAQADGLSCKMAREAMEKACGVKKPVKRIKKRVMRKAPPKPVEEAKVVVPPAPAPEAPKPVEVAALVIDNGFFAASGGVGPAVEYYGGGGGGSIVNINNNVRSYAFASASASAKSYGRPRKPHGGGGCGCTGGHGGHK